MRDKKRKREGAERDRGKDRIAKKEARWEEIRYLNEGFEGVEEIVLCVDRNVDSRAEAGGRAEAEEESAVAELAVKKIGKGSEWRARIKREIFVHRRLCRILKNDLFVLPLRDWWVSSTEAVIITPYTPLGTLGDLLRNKLLCMNLNRQKIEGWIESGLTALNWLHKKARYVHTDTKTDNFLLVPTAVSPSASPSAFLSESGSAFELRLFDFDECWSRDDFFSHRNFAILQKYDCVHFLADLGEDLLYCGKKQKRKSTKRIGKYLDKRFAAKRDLLRASLQGTREEARYYSKERRQSYTEWAMERTVLHLDMKGHNKCLRI